MKQLREYQSEALKQCIRALKENDEPILLMASVGAGKSLILSELLLIFQRLDKKALCIVNNSELVRNNAQTFREQGGNPSIYCSALNSKDCSNNIVFATPVSVLNSFKKNEEISNIKFNIIVVDEAHAIDYKNHKSTFMRILRHYKQKYPEMRVLGATGTNFRYNGKSIVGKECLFKSQVGNITTSWLIDNNYLVKPIFDIDEELIIDFSSAKLNKIGKFNNNQLEEIVEKNYRLTTKIIYNLQYIMDKQNRFGCFIFCSTLKHCEEAYSALPKDKTAIITGNTPSKERTIILEKARKREIKYLINVQVLTVGIDVPGYDTLLFLRPTESLVLAVQMIGRVLRLYPGKKSTLILDCAGNIERHKDWDDPVIIDEIKQTTKEVDRIFPCPECNTLNGVLARRCIGVEHKKRCNYYFDWKNCFNCNKKVDVTSRYCPHCKEELIDPNEKLKKLEATIIEVQVKDSYFCFHNNQFRARYRINNNNSIYESYWPLASNKSKNMFYGCFIRKHIENSSNLYPHLQNIEVLESLPELLKKPTHLKLKWNGENWKISDKIF